MGDTNEQIENSDNSLKWETAEHETKDTVTVPETDQGWIGEVRHDQRRLGELTAVSPSTMDTRQRQQVFSGVLRVQGGQSMQRRQVSRLEDSRGYSKRNDGHNEGSVTS